jgi:Domain of unknown function (DUF6089)
MRRIVRIAFTVIFTLLLLSGSRAQESRGTIGFGLSAGASNYIGDLDDNFSFRFAQPAFGAHATFLFWPRVYLRATVFHGKISADDAKGSFSGNRYRNLSFYSPVNEAGLNVIYSLQNRKRGFSKRNRIAPYLFTGIAYFQFDPRRKLDGTTYHLQQIGTEGQYLDGNYPEPYRLKQWAIPVGGGFTVKLNDFTDLGIETGFRKTFTDYLDDVSTYYPDKSQLLTEQGPIAVQLSDPSNDPSFPEGKPSGAKRGSPKQDDWYVYTNVNITWYFSTYLFKAYKPKQKSKYNGNSCKRLLESWN